jgi:phage terminase large subunit-like protein
VETSTPSWLDALLAGLKAGQNPNELFAGLPPRLRELIDREWQIPARPDQLPPAGDWLVWLLLGGRGAGKTRAGAQWVRGMALGLPPYAETAIAPIALVGETLADVREVMIEGVSGILQLNESFARPQWTPSRRRIVWPNGAVAYAFSSEDPEALRGPQFSAAWSDELGKWRYPDACWDMLQFGLRLGQRPRQVVTTTPRPIPLLRRLIAAKDTIVTRAATRANAQNLAPGFLERVVGRYAGTRLGRQELDGELIEDRADALWQRSDIESVRVGEPPPLGRIVVAIDPPASQRSGICGIVAAGIGRDGIGYVLADATVREVRPDQWAATALRLYRLLDADALVAEVNQGGDMVEAVLREVDRSVPVTKVRATRGKWLRAEPVAALYAQGRIRHVGALPELEDEMCDFGPDGLSAGRSPDRVDALVWAITALRLGSNAEPKVRGV